MMKIQNIVILMISQLINCCTVSNAQQHSIGITGGYNAGTFLNFSKQDYYETKYKLKSGFSFASFYETNLESFANFRVGLQYSFQNTDMEIYYNTGHASFYKKMDYSSHLLNLNLTYVFQVIDREFFKLNVFLGPTFSYNMNSLGKGNGWDYRLISQIDTLGNPISTITTEHWERDDRKSKDLSRFNIGADLGLDFILPVGSQVDFLIQNKYTVYFTNASKMKNLIHKLFTGSLQVGVRYHLKK